MPRVARLASERVATRALVLRRTATGDADLLVTAFTEEAGLLTLSARSARRTSSKMGALEPIHTLRIVVETHPGRDIAKLAESKIERPRTRILGDAARLDAAFRALVWARSVLAPHQAERAVFVEVERALDGLEAGGSVPDILARTGLRILSALGYELDLDACVLCGRACGESASAYARASAGGLVCRACGGGAPSDLLLSGAARRAARGVMRGEDAELVRPDALIELVDAAFGAHAIHAPARRLPQGPR